MKFIGMLPFFLLLGCCVAPAGEGSTSGGQEVRINNRPLSATQIQEFENTYEAGPDPGNYWYDGGSGLWGYMGRESSGFILAGHDFGPLSPGASNGNTKVYLNGRELPQVELDFLEQLFGGIPEGRYWLDSRGNIGIEGDSTALANLQVALQEAETSAESSGGGGSGDSGGGEYYYNSGGGSYGGMSGDCIWVSSDAGSMMSC